jgi:hypothetical protein
MFSIVLFRDHRHRGLKPAVNPQDAGTAYQLEIWIDAPAVRADAAWNLACIVGAGSWDRHAMLYPGAAEKVLL